MDAVYSTLASVIRQTAAAGTGAGAALRRAVTVRAELSQYAALNSRVQPMAFAANRLNTSVTQLAALPVTRRNPQTGQAEPSEQTIHASQVQRLQQQLGKLVDSYNATLGVAARAEAEASQQALARVTPDATLQRLGVVRREDGTLQFQPEVFAAQVQGGLTRFADLPGTLSALKNFSAAVAHAASGVNADIQSTAATARQQLGEMQGDLAASAGAQARAMLEALVGSALNNSLSALGLGGLVDTYA